MASKVNKKFIVFLVLAVAVAATLIGGLYVLNVRGSVARSVRLGDEAVAANDMRGARDYYGRAVHKEPGNLAYLKKLEDATLNIVPKTTVEAGELYRGYLGILAHAARYDAINPTAHLRLLQELTTTARLTQQGWNNIETPALDMFRRIPESNPQRYLGKVYRAMSVFRRLRVSNVDEVTAGYEDAKEAVSMLPENDLAWATLMHGELVVADKLREGGRTGPAVDEQNAKVMQTLREAMQKCPNGPETARMAVMTLVIGQGNNIAPPPGISDEEIQKAAAHLAALMADTDFDMVLMSECADLLAAVMTDGAKAVVGIVQKYLDKHPEHLNIRQSLGMLQVMAGDLDGAEASARAVIDAAPLPTSLLSQLQPELRKMAGVLLMDIEGRRWAAAAEADRPARLAAMEAARNRLAELVTDKQNDTQLMRADARLAFITRQYGRAAQLYDRLVRETNLGNDPETLYFCAVSLENVSQYGLARERIIQALQFNAGNISLLVIKARLEISMGMRAEAANTARMFPPEELAKNEELQAIVDAINAMASRTDPLETVEQDPVSTALTKTNLALMRGDQPGARTIIATALEKSPDDLQLLNAAILVEIQSGQPKDARPFLDRAIALAPENISFRQYQAMLENDDPVVAMRELHVNAITDENERILSMLTSLRGMQSTHQRVLAQYEKTGDAENIAKVQTTLANIKNEKVQWITKATAAVPDHPRFVEFQLEEAVADKDWARAAQVVERCKALNSDEAGGNFYKGRMEFAQAVVLTSEGKTSEARAMYQEAVRSLEAASDKLGFASTVWKVLAMAHQALGQYAQTEQALEQAYKNNPNDLDVVRAYFSILMRRGDQTRALRIVRGARQFVPNDPQLRHMWLNLEGEVGDRATALKLRRALAREYPDDLSNALELAKLLSDTDPTRETIIDDKDQPVYSEQRWARMNVEERDAAIRQAKADWGRESDTLLATLTEKLGDDLRLAVLRSNVLKDRGDVEGGEQQLRKFIAARPEGEVTAEMLIELARYQMRVNHHQDAIVTLQQAVAHQDPTLHEADRELGQLFMRLGQFDKALSHLEPAIQAQSDPRLQGQVVECLLKLQRFDEAQVRLTELVAASGEDAISILLSASIAEGHGQALWKKGDKAGAEQKFAQQRDAYLRAQSVDPANTKPFLLQAQWFVSEYQRTNRSTALNDALLVLDAADKARAGAVDVSILRVTILKTLGDSTAAMGELRRLLDRNPEQNAARRELAQLYVQMGQNDAAITLMNEGIRNNPTIGLWHEALGDLLRLAKNDLTGGLTSYLKAYQLSPTPALLVKICDTVLASPSPDCRALVQKIEQNRGGLATNPALQEAYARALSCSKRMDEAKQQLREAYAQRKALIAGGTMQPGEIGPWFKALASVFAMTDVPGMVDASAAESFAMELTGPSPTLWEQRSLASVWISSGDNTLARAIEVQSAAIAKCPADDKALWLEMNNELANLLYAAQRHADAARTYEKMLEVKPDQVDVLNNLAYLTADQFKDFGKALPLAERALKLAPENAAVLDTAGWVYFLAGQYDKAQQHLRESARLQRAATTFLHLAEAQVRGGDLNGARQSLDDASRLEPDVAQRATIQRLAEDIRKAAGQGR